MRCLVTTAPSGDAAEARELVARFGLHAEERGGRTLPQLDAAAGGAPVLVLGARRADLYQANKCFRAGPGIAHLRVTRMLAGEEDPLVRAASLGAGQRVLDATLGLGGDALVAAQAVGETGAVVGLEHSPVLAAFTLAGLRRVDEPVAPAAARIEVRCADHRALLRELQARSFEVVLLDPMFRAPLEAGPLFSLLREHADPARLELADLRAAQRVARRGVLVKDAWPGRELHRLGLHPLPSRRLPRVVFGWAEAE